MAEFEDENATGSKMRCSLRNELSVKLVAFFAAIERDFWFVLADFAHQRCPFSAADVGRIADDEVEKKWRGTSGEWRVGQTP